MRRWQTAAMAFVSIAIACSSNAVDTSKTLFITFRLPTTLATNVIEKIGRVDLYLDEPGTTGLFATETALAFGTTEAGLGYESQTADVDGDGRYEFFFRVRKNPFGYSRSWTLSFFGPADIGSFNVRAAVFLGDGTALVATALATLDDASEAISFGPHARNVTLDFACEPSVCPPASFDAGGAEVFVDIVTTVLNLPADITEAAIRALDRVDVYLDELDGGATLFAETSALVTGVTPDGIPYAREVANVDQDPPNEYSIRLLANPFDGGQATWQSTWSMSVAGGSWIGAFAVRGRLWTGDGGTLVATALATTDVDGGAISFGPAARTVALTFSCLTPALCGNLDAGVDAGPNAGIDAGPDAGVDAVPDAGVDAGIDAGVLGPTFTAISFSADAGGAVQNPRIAVDPQGNLFAVWTQAGNVWAARAADAGMWSTPVSIKKQADAAAQPAIAVDTQGNATAVWQQNAGMNNLIWANRYSVATALWGDAGIIEGDTAYSHIDPQIVATPSGDMVAVWTKSPNELLSNRYVADSGTWTGRFQLSFSSAVGPRMGVDSVGNVLVAWAGGFPNGVSAGRFSVTGGWMTAVATGIDLPVETGRGPGLAVDSEGNAVVVAAAADGGRRRVWASRFIADAGWQPRVALEDGSVNMSRAEVAFDGIGNAFAAWQGTTDGGGGLGVLAARTIGDAGLGWGLETLVSGAGTVFGPQVVVSKAGVACILWWERTSGLWVSRYDGGAGWEIPVNLFVTGGTPTSPLALARMPAGRILVAWDEASVLRVGFLTP